MKPDRGTPELEIELRPIAPATNDDNRRRLPQPATATAPAPDPRRRRYTIAGAVAVAAIVVALLSLVGGDDRDPDEVTPAPTSASASTVRPASVRISSPNILGAPTNLLMWTFDNESRLQVLDLDSGELRPLGVRGGVALLPLFRNVVVFDGDNGSSVVSAIGATSTEQLGKGVYPVVSRDARTLWVLSNDAPRRWQKRAIDGTVLDVLPFEANYSVVHYSDRAVLLVSAEGTSLFDLVTRQQEFLTPTRVFAAGGANLLGRTCIDRSCTFTVIDVETRREREVLSDVSLDDASTATVSPDGDLLAISRTSAFGRRAEIVRVASGATQWQSPDIVVSSNSWSWSPDSRWFFVTVSDEGALAVDMRAPWVRTEIPLSLASRNGLAVTNR